MGLFEKVTRKFNVPSSKIFFIWKNFSFFRKDLEILKFFFEFFWIFVFVFVFLFLIYIHKQSSLNSTWNSWIQKNIETWNKQTNFKLNHDVANQMWSEAKLGYLLLLDPFRMLETWHAWTLIMIKWFRLALGRLEPWLWSFGICLKWLGLTLGRHASCEFLTFDLAHVFMHLWWAQVLGLDPFKKQFWASIPSRIQS